ncbi:MAG TPA: glycosyltransferase family 2 protein [Chitinophagaceae bacterium]
MPDVVIVFWVSLCVLFFCYAGYGILLFIWNKATNFFVPARPEKDAEQIPVTLIVAIYNEIGILAEKIHNSLSLEYPPEKLKLIFITDGSVDGSDEMLADYPAITVLHQQERRGKLAAIKRAMQLVQTPVVVFSDANTILNKECIQQMMKHYRDPKVGGVAGEKKILDHGQVSGIGEAEGLYWKYESFMKKQDAGFYTVVGAAGELFSIRTHLFHPLDDSIILDDFIISMKVCLQGYKIAYEPAAFAVEFPSASLAEEEKRKVRISAGAYQSIGYLSDCLNIVKHPLLSFQYISRRLLRWVFCPLLLLVLIMSNILIVIRQNDTTIYNWLLYAQLVFYVMVIPGWLIVRSGKKAGLLAVPFYFVFMNYCLVKGFFRFVRGKQTVLWEKSLRQATINQ